MDKSRANILQIQKYLNGELDAKAMHKLEREAQDDPFLMDALEGYQSNGNNQLLNLDMLSAQLNARVNKKERRIIPWTTISIAAGVIGFMVVVGLLYKGNNNPAEPKLAQKIAPATASSADTVQALTPPLASDKQVEVAALPPVAARAIPIQKITNHATADGGRMQAKPANASVLALADTMGGDMLKKVPGDGMPLDEVVMNTMAIRRDTVEMPLTVPVARRSMSQVLTGKVAGVSTSEFKKAANDNELRKLNLPAQYLAVATANNNPPKPDGKGRVGATSITSGTYKSGYAAQSAASEPGLVGFENSNMIGNAGISSNSLNNNLGSNKDYAYFSKQDDLKTAALAHPEKGWVMYQLYLSQKCTLPAGEQAGRVEVKFTVSATGAISNIAVTKSLSVVADKKAIQIIDQGPKWVGNTNGKPEEKTLQLEFINK